MSFLKSDNTFELNSQNETRNTKRALREAMNWTHPTLSTGPNGTAGSETKTSAPRAHLGVTFHAF